MDTGGGKDRGKGSDSHDQHRHRSPRQYFSGGALKTTLLIVVVAVTCLLLNQPYYPIEFFRGNLYATSFCDNRGNASSQFHQFKSQDLASPVKEETDLASILRKAAMKDNRTVIITTVNAAWMEPNTIFDEFLESFRIGIGTEDLLGNVVVGAMDQIAYSLCLGKKDIHCFALKTDGVDFSGAAFYMTEDYLKMVWRKIDFQMMVLEMGYDFIFTDADVLWFRNPFPRFYPDGDFQISCDQYSFNYTDPRNSANSGFIYVKSNNRTHQFYKYWYSVRHNFPGRHDQFVFDVIKHSSVTRKIGLEIRFLSTAYFAGFCQSKTDLDVRITMHANCCVGMINKTLKLKAHIDAWKRYVSALPGRAGRNVSSGRS